MTPVTLLELIVLAGVAAYVQTLAGFALGLVFMGGIGLTGLMDLPDAAVLVSIMTVVNAMQTLRKGWRDVAWREFCFVAVSSILVMFLGYALLEKLAGTNLDWVRLLLGVAVIASSVQLLLRPHPLAQRSPAWSFVGFGAVAGLMGGLFSTSGPPLVYHFYRQPFSQASVRETLVLVFASNGIVRLVMVGVAGRMPPVSLWWTLLAVPAVVVFTFLARRWPPPISQTALRRAAFVLLFLSGLSLGVPAIAHLGGHP